MRILNKFTVRKIQVGLTKKSETIAYSLEAWIESYLELAVRGVRLEVVTQKITLRLRRFHAFFVEAYGHDRLSACLRRDVIAWQHSLLAQVLAHSTINHHLASLSLPGLSVFASYFILGLPQPL